MKGIATAPPPLETEKETEKHKVILERIGIRRQDIEADLQQLQSAQAIQAALITSRKKTNRESALALMVLNQKKDHYPKLDSGRRIMLSWRTWARQVLKRNRANLSVTEVINEAQKEFQRRATALQEKHGIGLQSAKAILAVLGGETLSLQPNQKMVRATTPKEFARFWMEAILEKPRSRKVESMIGQKLQIPVSEELLARYHDGLESKIFVQTRVATILQKLRNSPGETNRREITLACTAANQLKLMIEIRKDLWDAADHPDFKAIQSHEAHSAFTGLTVTSKISQAR